MRRKDQQKMSWREFIIIVFYLFQFNSELFTPVIDGLLVLISRMRGRKREKKKSSIVVRRSTVISCDTREIETHTRLDSTRNSFLFIRFLLILPLFIAKSSFSQRLCFLTECEFIEFDDLTMATHTRTVTKSLLFLRFNFFFSLDFFRRLYANL